MVPSIPPYNSESRWVGYSEVVVLLFLCDANPPYTCFIIGVSKDGSFRPTITKYVISALVGWL